ncbi:MAG: hypothetical protein M1823_003216 [Watsoniomyces obsoletus]|nr:MAG: hypothetical protein M1823_003216 [Watsoniomyces obsoletus]
MSGSYLRAMHARRSATQSPYRRDDRPGMSPAYQGSGYVGYHHERVIAGGGTYHREAYPMHGADHGAISRPHRPTIDTRRAYSPAHQYPSSAGAHQASPQSGSPYGDGRHWGPPQPSYHSQHSPNVPQYHAQQQYRTSSYPPAPAGPSRSYYHDQQSHHGHYGGHHVQVVSPYHQQQPHRAPSQPYPSGHQYGPPQDRRYSGSSHQGYQSYAPRRGGHYNNLHWNANATGQHSRGSTEHPSTNVSRQASPQGDHQGRTPAASPPPPPRERPPPPPPLPTENGEYDHHHHQHPARPSTNVRVEDEPLTKTSKAPPPTHQDEQKMPPPARPASKDAQDKGGPKISFTIKTKAAPPPKTDFSQKMREMATRREPAATATTAMESSSTAKTGTISNGGGLSSSNKRPREPEPEPERAPQRRMAKRLKAKATLSTEFAASESVYFRKPGNESVVGSGTYGKVFKAIHVYTKQMVALKKIRMEGERDGFPVTAIREIKLLQSLKHENVVQLLEVMVEKNDCFMVFEYLSHDLTGLLNHPTFKLDDGQKKHLSKQLFEGLEHLHNRGVMHRDIKAANILISNEGQLKLADFGLARFFVKSRQLDYTNRVITIWYRSPELLLGETQYSTAVDIWSAACVLMEIFTKHAIFPGDGGEINQLDKIYNIIGTPTRTEWPAVVDTPWFELLRPTERKPNLFAEKYQSRLTPAAFDLVKSMFRYDPLKRPSATDVLNHAYYTTEDPPPRQAVELRNLEGDWHEFESKALRKENERRDKEARRQQQQENGHHRDTAHGKANSSSSKPRDDRDNRKTSDGQGHRSQDQRDAHAKERERMKEKEKEREKRKASNSVAIDTSGGERDAKRRRPS